MYGTQTESEFSLTPAEKTMVDDLWDEFNEYRNNKEAGEEYELIQDWGNDPKMEILFKLKEVSF